MSSSMSFLFKTLEHGLRRGISIVPKRQINNNIWDNLVNPRPKPGIGKCFKRIVHYEDKYTIKPLKVTNLAGRDPQSGRLVVKGLGGGIKHKYHWIEWKRWGPTEDVPPIEERVIKIIDDGCRSAKVALVAGGNEMKYYLAADRMKEGDIIKTSSFIPRIPVVPSDGDAYPLGALQVGTKVHNIERTPGAGGTLVHSAGSSATILRKQNKTVTLKMPSHHEFIMDERCMATVGKLSNPHHGRTPIGSPNRLRELGFRPRSGLWHRKTGRFGRKIKPPKKFVIGPKKQMVPEVYLD